MKLARATTAAFLAVFLIVALLPLAGSAAQSDTLRINVPYTPPSLNPILSTTVYQNFISRIFNDSLIATSADGTMTPMLAREVPTLANGGISRDGLHVTYHLRPGIRWQDGVPFTSRDIAFTWRAIMNPRNNVQVRAIYAVVDAVDTPDDLTVAVRLKHPAAPFIAEFMTNAYPLPEHLLGADAELNDVPFDGLPVGVGPFRVVRWDRGSQIELDANDAYYLGRPKLRHIVIHLVSNENSAELQLRTHAVDVLTNVSFASYARLRGTPGLQTLLESVNSSSTIHMQTTRPPLDDVRVRRAIALAIDRASIANKVGFGAVTPSNGADITSASWAFDATLAPTPFDPAQARTLLRSAGWTPGPDGIARKGAKRLELTLVYSTASPTAATVALLVADMLRAAGIELTIKSIDPTILFAPAAQGGVLESGNFDLNFSGFQDYDDPDDSQEFSCENVAPAGYNIARYCTDELRRLQADALTHYDRAVRKRAYAAIERAILRDAPVVVLYWPRFVHVYAAGVHGLEGKAGFLSPYRYLWSVERN